MKNNIAQNNQKPVIGRREFLTMALGAALAVPALAKSQSRTGNLKAANKAKLLRLTDDFINGSNEERRVFIANFDEVMSVQPATGAKKFMQDYRDVLLENFPVN